jgi:hypothetical protein
MLMLNPAFENIEHLVTDCIHASGKKQVLSRQQIEEFYKLVLPTVDFVWDPEAQRRYSLESMTRISDEQIRALRSLDINDRVLVSGVAGSGKTRLALWWAHQSARSGRNTFLSCYNVPLGQHLAAMFEHNENVVVGNFVDVISAIPGMAPLVVPGNAGTPWYQHAPVAHIAEHGPGLAAKFDTIIVDEGQDFFPLWFTALGTLRASGDDSRMFITADQRQAIYAQPWTPPAHYARVPLHNNLRNSRTIATLISGLGGAQAPTLAPQGPKVEIVRVGGAKERRKAVGKAIKKVHEELEVPLSQILVLAPHRVDVEDLTSELTEGYALTTWFDRTEDSVVCGTIQGTKGLERAAVILTCMDDTLEEALVYIGASRAVTSLTIIGRESFLASLNPRVATSN